MPSRSKLMLEKTQEEWSLSLCHDLALNQVGVWPYEKSNRRSHVSDTNRSVPSRCWQGKRVGRAVAFAVIYAAAASCFSPRHGSLALASAAIGGGLTLFPHI